MKINVIKQIDVHFISKFHHPIHMLLIAHPGGASKTFSPPGSLSAGQSVSFHMDCHCRDSSNVAIKVYFYIKLHDKHDKYSQ